MLPNSNVIDPDAQAFITAAGITDATQKNAINRLVKNYKGVGDLNASVDLWTGSKAIYPLVGGSATSHKFNLKDPRDLDVAFRLAFSGGWTHSANGALPNGTNAFADSFVSPSTHLSLNNVHLSYYSRTNISANQCEIGSINGATSAFYLIYSYSGSGFKGLNAQETNIGGEFSPTTGLLIGSRINGTEELYTHRTGQQTITKNSTSLSPHTVYLGAYHNPLGAFLFSTKQCAYASIGNGYNLAEQLLLNTIIQAFQTDLSRQV